MPRKTVEKIVYPIQKCLIIAIYLYRYCISPIIPNRCRFYPSCSCYAQIAIQSHGILRGCWMSLSRILRCHPWHPGGYDPVPQKMNTIED